MDRINAHRMSTVSTSGLAERWWRSLVRAGLLGLAIAVFAGSGRAEGSGDRALQADRIVPSCTPQLVQNRFPGTVDTRGSGIGNVAVLRSTDAHGTRRPDTSATIQWSARAIVTAPRDAGAAPHIGGNLDLVITTGAGERLTFAATCIAGSGAFPIGLVLYANGLTRGWPGSAAVRRGFVHFEAWTESGREYAYVALIDGSDCELNPGVNVVTQSPYAVGTGDFSGLPPRVVYSETDCARRFGNPFSRSVALGLDFR